jgi:transcriptional regulator with XRE-family HTH domain
VANKFHTIDDHELAFEPIGLRLNSHCPGQDGHFSLVNIEDPHSGIGKREIRQPAISAKTHIEPASIGKQRDAGKSPARLTPRSKGDSAARAKRSIQPGKKTLGQVLKHQRQALGLSQRELAERLNVKAAHISYIELGQRRPSLSLFAQIARVLGLERQSLFLLAHPEAGALIGALGKTAGGKKKHEVWEDFRTNKSLLARHQVKPSELRVLSQINLLGKIAAPRQFLFVLNSIRQAVEEE